MKFLKSYGLAFLILLGIAGWMMSGTLIQGGRGPGQGERPLIDVVEGEEGPLRGFLEAVGILEPLEDAPEEVVASVAEQEGPDERQLVRIATFDAQDMPMIVNMRGRTRANAQVAVRAETNGTVREVHVTKGSRVEAGDLLCTLDQGTRQVRLASAEAQLEQAQADLDNNVQLRERGVAAANTSRQFEVALRSAQANYDEAELELQRTEIRAEVAGIIQDPLATVGDSLSAGAECAAIVQLDPMLFVGQVPEARVGMLREGEIAQVRTVTGEDVEGEVRYVSATADQGTRAFDVEISIPNPDNAIRDGITAQAFVQIGSIRAHLVPQSVLTLDVDGSVGVRAVEDDTVAFYPVEIAQDTRDGIWITGLPESVDLITVGQEFVQSGEIVNVSRGDGA
jgi:membrane fusion protein, multidrug efflux system